jgi:hypothetical protein
LTSTVNSPLLPSTSSTWAPGSFLSASATRAACSRVEAQTGHWRIVTFFIAHSFLESSPPLRGGLLEEPPRSGGLLSRECRTYAEDG